MADEPKPNQGAQGDAPTQVQGSSGAAGDAGAGSEQAGAAPEAGESPLAAQRAAAAGLLEERPEIAVGGAFAGGFVLAKLLGKLGR